MNLSPAQLEAFHAIMARQHAMLYGTMGAGKTRVATAVIVARGGSALVLAPREAARDAWHKELSAAGLEFEVLVGKPLAQVMRAFGRDVPVIVLSPDQFPGLMKAGHRDTITAGRQLIIDEIDWWRAPGSRRVKAMRRATARFSHVLSMTGTPVSESIEGMYAMMLCTDGGKCLGTRTDKYMDLYFEPLPPGVTHGRREPRKGAMQAVATRIAPLVVAMPDYRGELPLFDDITVWFDPPAETREVMRILAKERYAMVGERLVTVANMGVLQALLTQLASGVLYDGESDNEEYDEWDTTRVDAADRWQRNMSHARLVVFYELRADRDRFHAQCTNRPVFKTTDPDWMERWKRSANGVLLAHPRSLGHGVNLQNHCSVIAWLAPNWGRGLTDQGNARVWRTGQHNPVVCVTFAGRGTVDEVKLRRLETKEENDEAFRAFLASLRDARA